MLTLATHYQLSNMFSKCCKNFSLMNILPPWLSATSLQNLHATAAVVAVFSFHIRFNIKNKCFVACACENIERVAATLVFMALIGVVGFCLVIHEFDVTDKKK